MKKTMKRLLTLMLTAVLTIASSNMSVLAAGTGEAAVSTNEVTPRFSTLGVGSHYLGNFTFTNMNRGGIRVITGNRMRVCVAFKKADTQSTNIDVILDIDRYFDGGYYVTRQSTRFMSKDVSPDANGYHYFVGDWYYLGSDSGQPFSLYYDAVTEYGKTGNGSYRAANIYVWIEVE